MDAPERIWAVDFGWFRSKQHVGPDATEYVRADLYAKLKAELMACAQERDAAGYLGTSSDCIRDLSSENTSLAAENERLREGGCCAAGALLDTSRRAERALAVRARASLDQLTGYDGSPHADKKRAEIEAIIAGGKDH